MEKNLPNKSPSLYASLFPRNKKAAEMTIGTIIIIVLALVVLVILIFGFSTGWTNLWEKITAFGGGEVNVQSAVQSCQIACTIGGRYDYCDLEREIIFQKGKDAEKLTCGTLQKRPEQTGLECPAINCDTGENCESLGDRYKKYTNAGRTRCPAGTEVKNTADAPAPSPGQDRQAWCCQKRSSIEDAQKSLRLAECKSLTTTVDCTAADCIASECNIG